MDDGVFPPILVLGLGNPLMADDGVGVELAQRLERDFRFPPEVGVVEGGTQGLYLTPYVAAAEKLLILDAMDLDLPAGSVRVLEREDMKACIGRRPLSPHQLGVQDLMAAAMLLGKEPSETVLIGIQAENTRGFGEPMTARVADSLDEALGAALDRLSQWGFPAEARS